MYCTNIFGKYIAEIFAVRNRGNAKEKGKRGK
jgi:hypothetical protein